MKYKDNNEVLYGDIVLAKANAIDREKIAIVIDDSKDEFIKVKLIETGIDIVSRPNKVTFIKHTTKREVQLYIELAEKLKRNRKERFENFDYIIENMDNDNVINDISAPYLVEKARLNVSNHGDYVVNCIKRISYLRDGICIAKAYRDSIMARLMLEWASDYDKQDIEDILAIHYLIY